MFSVVVLGGCLAGCSGKVITFGVVDPTPLVEFQTGGLKIAEGKWIDWSSLSLTLRVPAITVGALDVANKEDEDGTIGG